MSQSLSSNEVTIPKLKKSDWQRVKKLGLLALKEDPQAFGSNFQKEYDYSDELWQERLDAVLRGKSWLVCAECDGEFQGAATGWLASSSQQLQETCRKQFLISCVAGCHMRLIRTINGKVLFTV
ncbi:hypothetical protein KBC79_00910 [Candidatus Woesebacteria bacterium]|nr:hypothetical protein [Candidatus Woesebacteria bacterium]